VPGLRAQRWVGGALDGLLQGLAGLLKHLLAVDAIQPQAGRGAIAAISRC
jgi:hypothetical protein